MIPKLGLRALACVERESRAIIADNKLSLGRKIEWNWMAWSLSVAAATDEDGRKDDSKMLCTGTPLVPCKRCHIECFWTMWGSLGPKLRSIGAYLKNGSFATNENFLTRLLSRENFARNCWRQKKTMSCSNCILRLVNGATRYMSMLRVLRAK